MSYIHCKHNEIKPKHSPSHTQAPISTLASSGTHNKQTPPPVTGTHHSEQYRNCWGSFLQGFTLLMTVMRLFPRIYFFKHNSVKRKICWGKCLKKLSVSHCLNTEILCDSSQFYPLFPGNSLTCIRSRYSHKMFIENIPPPRPCLHLMNLIIMRLIMFIRSWDQFHDPNILKSISNCQPVT